MDTDDLEILVVDDGTTLLYKILEHMTDDGTRWSETMFYSNTETVKIESRKFLFFGEKVTKVYPKFMFKLNVSIKSNNFTKSEMKSKIIKGLELYNRSEEIEKGEII